MRTVFPSRSRRRRAPLEVREIVPPPTPRPNAWADVLTPARKACKRVGCGNTFPTNGTQVFCTTRCKYRHEYQVNKSPTKIKQCARPGCGDTFPDRRGGPLYCADCRKIVRKEIKRAWQLRNRERTNPIRAAQQRARRAAWSTEKHEHVKAQMLARYYAKKQPPKETQCECGKIFFKTGNQKYCGGDCPVKLERESKTKRASFNKWYRKKNPLTLKPCEICEKEFHDKNGRGRVCPDCREDFRADQNRKRCKKRYHAKKLSPAFKQCPVDGKMFPNGLGGPKYCSQKCKDEANRAFALAGYHRRKEERHDRRS